jgi:hypothetical protein
MDSLTSICFALTSHKHYGIVTDVTKIALKALCPPFISEDKFVKVDGETEHECYTRQLWVSLRKRCVYCGFKEKDAGEYNEERKEWKYLRHPCRGFLAQPLRYPPLPSSLTGLRVDPARLYGGFRLEKEKILNRRSFETTVNRFGRNIMPQWHKFEVQERTKQLEGAASVRWLR